MSFLFRVDFLRLEFSFTLPLPLCFILFFPLWFFFLGSSQGFAAQQLLLASSAATGELLIHFRFWSYRCLFLPPTLGKGNPGFPTTCWMLGPLTRAVPLAPPNHPAKCSICTDRGAETKASRKQHWGLYSWLSESRPFASMLLGKRELELWNIF